MAQSFLDQPGLSRGLRNNNPGNLRPLPGGQQWNGEIEPDSYANFSRFVNVAYGLRAMITDVLGDIVEGKNTIRKVISEYSPYSENNTAAYITKVSSATGWGPDQVIKRTRTNIDKLIRAMLTVEIGNDASKINAADMSEAFSILSSRTIAWISQSSSSTGTILFFGAIVTTAAIAIVANLSKTKRKAL